MKRRKFIFNSLVGGLAVDNIGSLTKLVVSTPAEKSAKKVLFSFGVCADLHQDIIPDGERRLNLFIEEMNRRSPDFIIQLGDFCQPRPSNKPIIDTWDKFKGPAYHVIGNHDTDGGFTLQQVLDFWKCKKQYYSFDHNKYHFVVLNANEEKDYKEYKGPSGIISEEQKSWLEKDLIATNLPVVIFCHQGIDNDVGGVNYGTLIRVIFERENQRAGFKKVRMVLSGHHHQDYYNIFNGIHYVQINSMSYQWMGDKYPSKHYSEAQQQAHPVLNYIAPYAEPLWALFTVYDDGEIKIIGKKSIFISPSPQEMNRPEFHAGYPDVPYISDRNLKF